MKFMAFLYYSLIQPQLILPVIHTLLTFKQKESKYPAPFPTAPPQLLLAIIFVDTFLASMILM